MIYSRSRKNGATAVLVDRPVDCSVPQLIVNDTLIAFGKISQYWRKHFRCRLPASQQQWKNHLKNMIASILRAGCENPADVLATQGNLNNHIGVPIMLSRLSAEHRFAVIEMA